MKKKNYLVLIVSIVLAEGLGFLSATFAGDIRLKYETLVKPMFSPPEQVFGIAWAILYLLMAVAAYLLYQSSISQKRTLSLILYGMQLLVNFSWSIIFFRADMFWLAFGIIIVLDLLVIFCITQFASISKAAAWLMAPYFLWLLFATYLNAGFALLN